MSSDYTQLITSQHADKPRFTALVQAVAGGIGAISDTILSLPHAFDLDLAAGAQLDVIGLWVGQPRDVAGVPTTEFFGFEDNIAAEIFGEQGFPSIGGRFFEEGEQFQSTVVLADPEYRLLLKSKIVRNQSDGTAADLIQALIFLFGFVRANFLLWSEQFQQSYWSKTSIAVTADAVAAPDGETTADLITASAGSGGHSFERSLISIAGGPVTFSLHAKYVNYRYLKIAIDDTQSQSRLIATFDLQTGVVTRDQTVGQASQLRRGIIALAGGWWRIWVSGVIPPAGNGDVKRVLAMFSAGDSNGYDGITMAGTEQFHCWGAQLEAGEAPGPYIRIGGVNTAKIVDTNDKVVTIQLPEALVSLTQLALLENLDLLPRTAGINYTIQTI